MITTGSDFSISLGGSVGMSCVVSRMMHGTAGAVTAKAVQFRADNGATMWLPKAALTQPEGRDYYKLAAWFKPSQEQWAFIERYESISGVTA